jgi:predicted glycoside hydrolase/deacetylase ChbG (UPF0249 family)
LSTKEGAADGVGTLVLCADDYGITEAVSRSILELIDAGRLSATSCMTVMDAWPATAGALAAVADKADIGLHVTLTDHRPLGAMPGLAPDGRLPSLARLASAAMARRIDRAEVADEVERQLEAFVAATGRLPDHVDGHQHAHVFPVIRDAVLDVVSRRLGSMSYVRHCWEPAAAILRRRVDVPRALTLARLSAELRQQLLDAAIPANDSFRGVNAFNRKEDFRMLFRRWLDGRADRPLAMCHPGRADAALRQLDSLTDRREDEYAYLAGDDFPRDLAEAGWLIGRFPR